MNKISYVYNILSINDSICGTYISVITIPPRMRKQFSNIFLEFQDQKL